MIAELLAYSLPRKLFASALVVEEYPIGCYSTWLYLSGSRKDAVSEQFTREGVWGWHVDMGPQCKAESAVESSL